MGGFNQSGRNVAGGVVTVVSVDMQHIRQVYEESIQELKDQEQKALARLDLLDAKLCEMQIGTLQVFARKAGIIDKTE